MQHVNLTGDVAAKLPYAAGRTVDIALHEAKSEMHRHRTGCQIAIKTRAN